MKALYLFMAAICITLALIYFLLTPKPKEVTLTPDWEHSLWTCSMHPQVRLPKPGLCPICGMPLVAEEANKRTPDIHEHGLQLNRAEVALAGVSTVAVGRREMYHVVRATGKIEANESTLANVVVRVDGFAEKLHVDYTGVDVKAGDHLVDIYSPELLVAQQELLTASRPGSQGADLTRAKLLRLGLTSQQVRELEQSGKVQENITLFSPISGTVLEKLVIQNNAVKAGEILYRVANLDSVWVTLDLFERDLPRIKYGQSVDVTVEGAPGLSISGRIWFISPTLTEETRTVKVVVTVPNQLRLLKPGMYIVARIPVPLLHDGHPAPTGVAGMFTCAMHPDVLQDSPGLCRVCAMSLVVIPAPPVQDKSLLPLALPKASVLDAGRRKIVIVEKPAGFFAPLPVQLGPESDGYYLVLSGVSEGDQVVATGNFFLDSQLQLEGHASLFFQQHQAKSSVAKGSDPGEPNAATRDRNVKHSH